MSCPNPIARSYIPEPLAQNRIKTFIGDKWIILDQFVQHAHTGRREAKSVPIAISQFRDLVAALVEIPNINGLRIYFGSYKVQSPMTDPYLDPDMEHVLMLIFAPTDDDKKDTGDYFMIDTTGKLPAPSLKKFPDGTIPGLWRTNYVETKKLLLELYGKHTDPNFKETESIWFLVSDFTDWLGIINCSGRPGCPIIKSMQITFGTYMPNDTYHDQLGIVVELLDPNNKLIKLEKYDWFKKGVLGGGGSFDTGLPCPPASC